MIIGIEKYIKNCDMNMQYCYKCDYCTKYCYVSHNMKGNVDYM